MDGDPVEEKKTERRQGPPTIVLGYWKCRGLAQPIRYILELSGQPYKEIIYEQDEEWNAVKDTLGLDVPALPYLVDKNKKFTDVEAIMLHLAIEYAPELHGKTPEETAELTRLYQLLK